MGTDHVDCRELLLSEKAVDAVARHMYGDLEYDALQNTETKNSYRKKARALLQLALDAIDDDTRM